MVNATLEIQADSCKLHTKKNGKIGLDAIEIAAICFGGLFVISVIVVCAWKSHTTQKPSKDSENDDEGNAIEAAQMVRLEADSDI